MDSYNVDQVFTPSTQAKANFVARPELEDRITDALRTPGKQVVVYGHSGSGKSSLIYKKLEQLYEGQVITRCTKSMTFDAALLDAFDQLDQYFVDGRTASSSTSSASSIETQYFNIKAELSRAKDLIDGESKARLVPPQLTPQRLAQFLGNRNCCWVLEDFHKVAKPSKVLLSQAMKVFVDESSVHKTVRVIAIGAVETARQVVQYDQEMRTRVAEILVPVMSPDELRQIFTTGERLLNVAFGKEHVESAVECASGLASVCHEIALAMCHVANIDATVDATHNFTGEEYDSAFSKYVWNCSDTVKSLFEKALRRDRVRKYDNTRLILTAIAQGGTEGQLHAEILRRIKRTHKDYSASSLTQYLQELTTDGRGALIRCDQSNRYKFADPVYLAHAKATLLSKSKELSSNELTEVVRLQLLEIVRNAANARWTNDPDRGVKW